VFRAAESVRTRARRIVAVRRDRQDVLPGMGRTLQEPPGFELRDGPGGGGDLLAWQPGRYELMTAAGTRRSATVEGLPPALELRGPWQVQFPPNRGAPERVTFERLISWSDHDDPGVRYFAGTAAYRSAFQVPAESLGKARRLFLDLGRVEVIAQARLNGKDLGPLWKPPFRVEVTGALKPGGNLLEVKVVNLWVNQTATFK